MVNGGNVRTFGQGAVPVSMETTGDTEAAYIIEIADALRGREIGLLTMGKNEDSTFSIVVEAGGVFVSFTSPNPSRMKDAFIAWALAQR
jgi:hypothetical protein